MFRDSKKTGSPPTFPLYLLPSLSIPFRRRKTTPATELTVLAAPTFPSRALDHGSLSSTPDSGMPSLSSSPESILSDPSSVTTPASPLSPVPGFFWNAMDKPSSSKEPQTPHLTRTQPDTLRCAKCATDVAFAAQIVSKGFTGRHGRAFLVSPPSAASTPTCPASPIAGHPTPSSSDARSAEANLVNVRVGDPEKRQLVTGAHIVADINCVVCDSKLGWKYVNASEWTQKYKIGKFILETAMVVAHRAWEDDDVVVSAVEERRQHATRGHGGGASRRDSAAYSQRDSVASTTLHEFAMDEIADLEHGRTEEESEVVFDSGDEEECEDLFAGQWDARIVARRRSRQGSAIKGQYAGR